MNYKILGQALKQKNCTLENNILEGTWSRWDLWIPAKKCSSIHDRLVQQLNEYRLETKIPKWMTKVKNILIQRGIP